MTLGPVICGDGSLANGVAENSIRYDGASRAYAISFSTATSPAQIFLVEHIDPLPAAAAGQTDKRMTQLTRNRVLGIPENLLAPGEDAGFTSHDGLHVPARLYLPCPGSGLRRKAAAGRVHSRRPAGPGAP